MKFKVLILMMITLMILTTCLMIPVKGGENEKIKTLIILEGEVENSVYEVEGYKIIDNQITNNVPGEYEISYQSLSTGEILQRKVIVISKTDKDYFDVESTTIETFKDYPMILEKVESLNEEKHLIIVRYLTDVETNKGHTYMYVIENNQVIKEVQLYYNTILEIQDLVIDGDTFVFTGRVWNSLYANYDIILCAYRSDGMQLCSKTIGGTEEDIAYKIEMTDKNYILMGLTDSTDGIFQENNKPGRYFIMSIDKETYEIIQIGTEPNEVSFDKLYFITNLGKLYLVYQTEPETIKLVNIDEKGNYLKTKTMKYEEDVDLKEVYIHNLEMYMLLDKKDDFEIGKINIKDGYSMLKLYSKNGDYVTSQYYDNSLEILFNNSSCYKYVVIDKNLNNVYEQEIKGLFANDSRIEMLKNQILENNLNLDSITLHKLSYIKINSIGTTLLKQGQSDYHDYSVIINGEVVKHDISRSNDFVNQNVFGTYLVQYWMEDDVVFIMNKEVFVEPICGIKDKGIYDVGIKLYPNGIGYLNNELIKEGYQINLPGEYKLELIGYQNRKMTFDFEVKELSVSKDIIEENSYFCDVSVEGKCEDIKEMKCEIISNDITRTPSSLKTWQWMYTIPVLFIVTLGFLIIKMKY